jgi:urease accessory protein UreH
MCPGFGVFRVGPTCIVIMLVPRQAAHGKGRAVLHAYGMEAIFSELSYQYPLKLLSPDTHADIPLAIAYILSYGGGLVSGDRIELDVDVGLHSMLMLLTQVRQFHYTSRLGARFTVGACVNVRARRKYSKRVLGGATLAPAQFPTCPGRQPNP